MSKFDQFMYTMPEDHHRWGDTYASPRCGFPGESVMPGWNLVQGDAAHEA